MTRERVRALVAAGVGSALVFAGAAHAAGSLPNLLVQPGAPIDAAFPLAPSRSTGDTGRFATPAAGTSGISGTFPAMTAQSAAEAPGARARANAVFDRLDANKDGVLSREEFARAGIRIR